MTTLLPVTRGELDGLNMVAVREHNMLLIAAGMVRRMLACVIITRIQTLKKPHLKKAAAGLVVDYLPHKLFGMCQKSLVLTHRSC